MSEDESENLASGETSEGGQSSPGRRSPVTGGPKTGSGGHWRKEDRVRSSAQSPRRLKEIEDKIMVHIGHVLIISEASQED
jgi:hypothetical protein